MGITTDLGREIRSWAIEADHIFVTWSSPAPTPFGKLIAFHRHFAYDQSP